MRVIFDQRSGASRSAIFPEVPIGWYVRRIMSGDEVLNPLLGIRKGPDAVCLNGRSGGPLDCTKVDIQRMPFLWNTQATGEKPPRRS